ncbi:MAG: hypothetical protein DHS20C21_09720 [Gemmatimonadota bacterium]|nr:MAG: hypothetical protein DHS20C21_09720 [Gemmatimonadota bacterium]
MAILMAMAVCAIVGAARDAGAGELLLPNELEYLGAFRMPGDLETGSEWQSGGGGMTYVPTGDAGGPNDGFPGSLMAIGKHPVVSEFSIPMPRIPEDDYDGRDLNRGLTLQPFADPTGGVRGDVDLDKLGGIAYLRAQPGQTTDKLYWTIYEYYNANGDNFLSHGMSELDLSNPQPQGAWRLGSADDDDFHSMKTADYIFDAPEDWADENLGGRYLVSGRHRENGAFGGAQGPALYAFAPWQESTLTPGAEMDAVCLLRYPTGGGHFPNYCAADWWSGGAWLSAGNRSAVMIVGSKGVGEVYYGEGGGNRCSSSKGFHCDPYEPQFLFYNPDELAAVARGELEPWQVLPYATIVPSEMWPKCRIRPVGIAFDRDRGLIYVMQYNGARIPAETGTRVPLVHTWRIRSERRPGAQMVLEDRVPDSSAQGTGGETADRALESVAPKALALVDPNGIAVSPNPSTGITAISLAAGVQPETAYARVYDLAGREVADLGQLDHQGVQWNAQDLSTGVYFVRVVTETGAVTKKVSLLR